MTPLRNNLMPFRRWIGRDQLAAAKNSDKLCWWCGGPRVRRPRWCSDTCQREYLVRCSSQYPRQYLFDRDGGRCCACGIDCAKIDRIVEAVTKRHGHPGRATVTEALGLSAWTSAWEADHIVPVSRGGGQCGLDGYQTLCWWCHKAKTHHRDGGVN